jgi:hypothetical protein
MDGVVPRVRPASATNVGPAAKTSRVMALSVNSVLGPSTETNYDVAEEPLDFKEIDAARRVQFIHDEFVCLRNAGPTKAGAYYSVPLGQAKAMLAADPSGIFLDCRWVHTEGKSRLTTREFSTFLTPDFFAATGNVMNRRLVPVIALKFGWMTLPLDARRAFLQVPETALVVIKPPKEWKQEEDFVEGHVWIALVKWYGERGAAQAWQEFFAEALVAIGFSRNRKDPTKFHHVERSIYVDSHVDDSHGTAPQLALAWLPPALEEATVAGVGDSYNYLQVTYTRVSLRRFIVTPLDALHPGHHRRAGLAGREAQDDPEPYEESAHGGRGHQDDRRGASAGVRAVCDEGRLRGA